MSARTDLSAGDDRQAPRTSAGIWGERPPHTLISLVAELKERATTESQDSLVEWLYSLTGRLGIRMRYDEHTEAAGRAPEPPAERQHAKAGEATAQRVRARPREPGSTPHLDGSDAPPPREDAGRRKQARSVPVTIRRGRMTVHFDDPALQEREPPKDGRFNHLCEGGPFVGRIILSCNRRRLRADAPLSGECNGAVIDARTWALLAVPPRAFAPRPSAKAVDRGLAAGGGGTGCYDVIQVSDGTVVTLYRWSHPARGPIWCLASSNGYDVSHLKWMGDQTYAEIVHGLLALVPGFAAASGLRLARGFLCEGDVRLDFAALDPARCYTLGFRHGNFHPMTADPPGIWNIQTAVLATGVPEYMTTAASPGLPLVPRQAIFTREDIVRLAVAGGRFGVGSDGAAIQMADLNHICRTALEDAKAAIAGAAGISDACPPPLPATPGVRVSPFNYGFILRSRSPGLTGAHSDILCETPLLRRVRQLVYQRPPRQDQQDLDEISRLEYNALKAFLSEADRDDFAALFPEFRARFALFKEFVENVIHLVIQMRRQDAMAPNGRPGGASARPGAPRAQTKTVARAILAHILRHADFKPFHADAKSIVHDFVVRPEYALLYLRAIGLPAE
jgi:hypothetical protein